MNDARKEQFELVMADNIPALFFCGRIDRGSVPDGLFCYDVRHDDECQGIACEIKSHVLVNHWGTLITKQEIPLEDGRYSLTDGLNYSGQEFKLDEFMQMDMEQLLAWEQGESILGMKIT